MPRHLDLDALDSYLSVNYVPGPQTLIEGIQKVPPGHLLEWRDGKSWMRTVVDAAPSTQRTRIRSKRRKRNSTGCCRIRCASTWWRTFRWECGRRAVWIPRRFCTTRRQQTAGRLKTFSVSFAGRSFDESRYFREIAQVYGTDHHEFDLNPDVELQSAIEDFAYYSDEPSADAGALPVWFLSRMSRRHVTVALSGEGADELFGGYLTYHGRTGWRGRSGWCRCGSRRLMRGAIRPVHAGIGRQDQLWNTS